MQSLRPHFASILILGALQRAKPALLQDWQNPTPARMTRYIMKLYMYLVMFGSLRLTMAVALLRDNPLQDVDRARRNEVSPVETVCHYIVLFGIFY